jgi:hypothetical protein
MLHFTATFFLASHYASAACRSAHINAIHSPRSAWYPFASLKTMLHYCPKMLLPGLDLRGMDVVLNGQFRYRFLLL